MSILQQFQLKGKVAVVTGGAGLFGRPISTALAEAGAYVFIASRSEKEGKGFAAELVSRGYQAEWIYLDLAEEAVVQGMVNEVIGRKGRVDVLVNNAVSREGFRKLEDMTVADWEAAQRINSTGLMVVIREIIGHMVSRQSGVILNIGSIQGVVGPNFWVYGETGMTSPVNYSYDKWGMVGFTKWVANYYGKYNIRCNCISPGGFGPGVASMYGNNEFVSNYKAITPMGRFADEEDIKGAIVFLASDASGYITGHNLVVDGGYTSV